MDGSVLDAGANFCRGVRFAQELGSLPVGLAASIGAGISMAFSEGLSDDGSLTGRGSPWLRGGVTGLNDHRRRHRAYFAFLIGSFRVAMLVAVIVVAVELGVISYIRHRYMDTPFLQASFQVIVGGRFGFLDGMADWQRVEQRFERPWGSICLRCRNWRGCVAERAAKPGLQSIHVDIHNRRGEKA